MTDLPSFNLNDGSDLPAIGLGTFALKGEEGISSLSAALGSGYRLLDTAVGYGNEQEVGEAIRRADVARDQIRVTSKIPGRDHGYDAARRSIGNSQQQLGVEQIDLHLIHWPNPGRGKYVDTWRALVDAQADGDVHSIGVSNFAQGHLERIIDATGVVPSVNQIEVHPHFPQREQRALNRELGICTEAWSPLGRQKALFGEASVSEAAARVGVTPAQVVLRWHHQLGCLPIPRSASPKRQRDNFDIGDFELTDQEVAAITALGKHDGRLWGGDPNTLELM